MSPVTYRVPAAHFDALAAGGGDAETITLLRNGQLSKHTLLVRAVMDVARAEHPSDHAAAGMDAAYALLADVQRTAPEVVRTLLLHPHVGAWAVHCLQRLHGAGGHDVPLKIDLGYLASVAASAAIAARASFEIEVPVRDGLAVLPTLGAARLESDECWTTATVRGDGSGAHVDERIPVPAQTHLDAPGWCPLRRLDAEADGLALRLDLEDLDPYRGHTYPSVADRLTEAEAHDWCDLYDDAWSLLVRHHHAYAVGLAAGLRSLVPQVSVDPSRSISATSTDAFGSIAMSRSPDPATFAVTLVHEFQHAKLSALLDLMPMYELRADVRYYAPWRDDPRPLGGLVQGVYAFLGVTDFWRVHRYQETASRAALAHFEFARWREQVRRATDELAASTELTEAGRGLIAGIRATVAGWDAEEVPADLAEQARDSAVDHRARWRVRNIRPDPARVAVLADAWLAGKPQPESVDLPEIVTGAPPDAADTVRFRLWHLRMTEPERFERLCADGRDHDDPSHGDVDQFAEVTAADIAYVRGDYPGAAHLYRAHIERAPETVNAWVGLALSRLRSGDSATGTAVLTQPELLRAVYRRLRDSTEPVDPELLARWLDRPSSAWKDTT